MPFFTYDQNNSGGSFVVNDDVTFTVIIEADNADHADLLAEQKANIYFDGIETGQDCECCGPRWSSAYGKGDKVPSIYGKPIEDHVENWAKVGQPYAYVYYLDGTKKVLKDRVST